MDKEKNNYFWQDGLSSDESRVSAVVIAFLATTAAALWSFVKREHIGPEMVLLMQTMITAVTGMNVVRHFSSKKVEQNLPVKEKAEGIDKTSNMLYNIDIEKGVN
jgi:hypothetical protein